MADHGTSSIMPNFRRRPRPQLQALPSRPNPQDQHEAAKAREEANKRAKTAEEGHRLREAEHTTQSQVTPVPQSSLGSLFSGEINADIFSTPSRSVEIAPAWGKEIASARSEEIAPAWGGADDTFNAPVQPLGPEWEPYVHEDAKKSRKARAKARKKQRDQEWCESSNNNQRMVNNAPRGHRGQGRGGRGRGGCNRGHQIQDAHLPPSRFNYRKPENNALYMEEAGFDVSVNAQGRIVGVASRMFVPTKSYSPERHVYDGRETVEVDGKYHFKDFSDEISPPSPMPISAFYAMSTSTYPSLWMREEEIEFEEVEEERERQRLKAALSLVEVGEAAMEGQPSDVYEPPQATVPEEVHMQAAQNTTLPKKTKKRVNFTNIEVVDLSENFIPDVDLTRDSPSPPRLRQPKITIGQSNKRRLEDLRGSSPFVPDMMDLPHTMPSPPRLQNKRRLEEIDRRPEALYEHNENIGIRPSPENKTHTTKKRITDAILKESMKASVTPLFGCASPLSTQDKAAAVEPRQLPDTPLFPNVHKWQTSIPSEVLTAENLASLGKTFPVHRYLGVPEEVSEEVIKSVIRTASWCDELSPSPPHSSKSSEATSYWTNGSVPG